MLEAINRRSIELCNQAITNAINSTQDPKIQQYIRSRWFNSTKKWAMCWRVHSPMLMQITSTNPIESYHAIIKKKVSRNFSLLGSTKKLLGIIHQRKSDSEALEMNFRIKKIKEVQDYPHLQKLPHPFQLMIVEEIHKVQDMIKKCKPIPDLKETHCFCKFHVTYGLPCKHMFFMDISGKTIFSDKYWDDLSKTYTSFDIYKRQIEVQKVETQTLTQTQNKSDKDKTKFKQEIELLQDMFYQLKECHDQETTLELLRGLQELSLRINQKIKK